MPPCLHLIHHLRVNSKSHLPSQLPRVPNLSLPSSMALNLGLSCLLCSIQFRLVFGWAGGCWAAGPIPSLHFWLLGCAWYTGAPCRLPSEWGAGARSEPYGPAFSGPVSYFSLPFGLYPLSPPYPHSSPIRDNKETKSSFLLVLSFKSLDTEEHRKYLEPRPQTYIWKKSSGASLPLDYKSLQAVMVEGGLESTLGEFGS